MRREHLLVSAAFLTVLTAAPLFEAWGQDRQSTSKAEDRIAREVRHELVTLPYYSVFDNLAYKVSRYTVTLAGQANQADSEARCREGREENRGCRQSRQQYRSVAAFADGRYDSPGRVSRDLQPARPGYVQPPRRAHHTYHREERSGDSDGSRRERGRQDPRGNAANGVPGVFSVTNDLLVSP